MQDYYRTLIGTYDTMQYDTLVWALSNGTISSDLATRNTPFLTFCIAFHNLLLPFETFLAPMPRET